VLLRKLFKCDPNAATNYCLEVAWAPEEEDGEVTYHFTDEEDCEEIVTTGVDVKSVLELRKCTQSTL